MSKHRFLTAAASLLCACASTQSAMAELPSLTEKEWLGRFAVSANSKYSFEIETTGDIKLHLEGSRKKKTPAYAVIKIAPRIEEMMPDGTLEKVFIAQIVENSVVLSRFVILFIQR